MIYYSELKFLLLKKQPDVSPYVLPSNGNVLELEALNSDNIF